ncbi:MAG: hypothetical protein K1X51_13315 [Rhodospirillaceae bacterium]|nr:hypothetical protein [Rhodospirillaceae bacterium]
MADILFYPPFPNRHLLFDQLFRGVWHFLPALAKLNRLIFPYAGDDFALLDVSQTLDMAKIFLSRDLDPAIAGHAPKYHGKIALAQTKSRAPADYAAAYPNLRGVIVWSCDAATVAEASAIAAATGAETVMADPFQVQQETLLTMRFVYKLFSQEELGALVAGCRAKFMTGLKGWKGRGVSCFGNGPSLAKVVEARIDPGSTVRAVCNSTIGDAAALDHLDPDLLVCGDPVQHWGASLYAGRFRADLARAMENPKRMLITQLGYVPYFKATMPEHAHDRAIGIGNDRRPQFNIDLTGEFLTAATANVLTMLMLPVAFTISGGGSGSRGGAVDIFGCDGMAFSQATKPWSHANEDDYMGKMAVTHRVHPGFWKRNYEEEYWSYCQDLEDIMQAAEAKGIAVRNRTPSFVPALGKRYVRIA